MNDQLTLVDEEDNVIGPISKLDGHVKTKITPTQVRPINRPHRAFSLFLFNSKNELLL